MALYSPFLNRNESDRRPTAASGFTLVELLVVVAIIAVLASMLLASLAQAKASAFRAVCINNQRQLYLGWFLYTQEHNGAIPLNHYEKGSSPEFASWVSGVMSYENESYFNQEVKRESTNTLLLIPGKFGSIGRYVGSPKVYRCPADRSWILLDSVRQDRVRSYSMNQWAGAEPLGDTTPYRSFFHESDFLSGTSAGTYIFLDEHEDTILSGIFQFPMHPTRLYALPSARHSGGALFTYADGHIGLKKWRDSRTKPPVERKRRFYFEAPGNIDMPWLKEHTTVLKSAF